jgi:hypothetical protein
MGDEDILPSLALYEVLREDFHPHKNAVEGLFKDESVRLFRARHARKLIRICLKDEGELDVLQVSLAVYLTSQHEELKQDADNRQSQYESLARRYDEALERRRLASGLPGADDIEKIQRYEAHLERGLQKHLDRLHQLKEERGAVPPRGPSVAVAVIQASPQEAAEGAMGPIGSFAIEAPEGEMASFGSFAVEAPEGEMAPIGSFHVEAVEMTEEPAGTDAQG